ncbi:MAG: PSD1 and planctomycete cytochrome C domain-containing protein [Planctomycetaceae bacterium]
MIPAEFCPTCFLPVRFLPARRWRTGVCLVCAVSMLTCPTARGDDDIQTLDGAAVEYFEKHVRPLLAEHCYECHAGGEVNGGLRVDYRDGILVGGDSGKGLVPGYPDDSLLIQAVRYNNRDLQMPPQNKLSDQQIAVLEQWVSMGAPDPRDTMPQSTHAVTGMSIEAGREFWSFRPLQEVTIPEVRQSEWVRNPIDAFVLAKLEAAGLRPAEPADRQTLIRRITFDLTGLPPSVDDVQRFVNDSSPDAWENLIERLLDSPQYGVRWGRHWLDVARYADSNGLDENIAYGTAWRYRDYVIDAFNNDKPFDRFVLEQLAGDLLPEASRETKTATGFLALGAKVLAEPDMEKLVMDTIDEQIDTTGKAFLGMTLGCVRCHDHKFDPILQTDYYGLAAIFRSTRTFSEQKNGAIKFWHEHSFADDAEKERLKQVESEIKQKAGAASTYRNQAIAAIRKEAQSRATEYLMAATQFEPSATFAEVQMMAERFNLHPGILYHCRRHLNFHRDDELFAAWAELAAEGPQAVEEFYRPLFLAASGKDASVPVEHLPLVDSAKAGLADASGFLAVPPRPEQAFDQQTLEEYHRLAEEARVFESQSFDETSAMGVAEQETVASLPIHIRGSHLNLGEPAARCVPQVMQVAGETLDFPADQSGRLQLAQWLTSRQHPLTARVFVNRVWGWHFGRALVDSTENFGVLGGHPSHPELLDWLSLRFMESGWSVKWLHRMILSSQTWQMASAHADEQPCVDADPENLLLWKFRLQRLEAEQIRDAVLAVSGRLDSTLGGKSIPLRNRQFVFNHTSVDHTRYDSLRRAAYLPIVRNNLYVFFEQFDFPDPTMPTGHRNSTTVAPQALLMMNADLVMDSASEFAERLLASGSDDTERIQQAYRQAFGRSPTDEETQRALAFIGELTSVGADAATEPGSRDQAWSLLCQSLFAANEFIYLR